MFLHQLRPDAIATSLGDETLVYVARRVHLLGAAAGRLLAHCGSGRTVEEVAQLEKLSAEVVAAGLAQIEAAGLLVGADPERRKLLKQLTAAAVLPAVFSVAAPRPALAGSTAIDDDSGMGCEDQGIPGFPPAGCQPCCDSQSSCCSGGVAVACPTVGNCFCATRIRCAGGNCCVGSCGDDAPEASPTEGFTFFCNDFPNSACCGGGGHCQRDCSLARQSACGSGLSVYHCCENCS